MLKAISIWLPPLIYVPMIFILSIRPMPEYIRGNTDKVIHLLVYALVGALFTRVLVSGMHIDKKKKAIALALISSIFLGSLIEGVQYFIPYRDASFADMIANAAGALIGVSIYILITKSNKGKNDATP